MLSNFSRISADYVLGVVMQVVGLTNSYLPATAAVGTVLGLVRCGSVGLWFCASG